MQQRTVEGGLGERIFAGVVGFIFLGQFFLALHYPPDPRLFPLIIAVIGMALCIALLAGMGLHDRELGSPERLPRASLVLTLLVSPVYGAVLWLFGYWLATLVAIPLIAMLLGYRSRGKLFLVSVATTIALGVLFPLLDVPLPVGLLPEKFGL